MANVLAWGSVTDDGILFHVSILNLHYNGVTPAYLEQRLKTARAASSHPIIELVDKAELDKALVRIAELETNQTLQP